MINLIPPITHITLCNSTSSLQITRILKHLQMLKYVLMKGKAPFSIRSTLQGLNGSDTSPLGLLSHWQLIISKHWSERKAAVDADTVLESFLGYLQQRSQQPTHLQKDLFE